MVRLKDGTVITEIAYDEDRKHLSVKASGEASVEGFQSLNTKMVEHQSWRPGVKALCDFRALDLSNISPQDAEKCAANFRALGRKVERTRIACIMKKDLDYGLTRMWAALAEIPELSSNIMVFRSIDDAIKWLHS